MPQYWLVREYQMRFTEYVVSAKTEQQSMAKAKVIDKDVVEISNYPTFVSTSHYESQPISDDQICPVIQSAMHDIESGRFDLEDREPPRAKKRKTRQKRKTKLSPQEIEELMEMDK